jgi:hypothetical protein
MLRATLMAHTHVMEGKENTIAGIVQCVMNRFMPNSFG